MDIGNIQPGANLEVDIVMVKVLDCQAGSYCIRIPTSYFPRYGESQEEGDIGAAPKSSKVVYDSTYKVIIES